MTGPVVRVADLLLRRSARVVLDHVWLEVDRGEIVAVMGASGSGKTTMLRAIAGLERFEHGTIEVDGAMLSARAPGPAALRAIRAKIGMVFQFHCLFEHLSAVDNVRLAPVHVHQVALADAQRQALQLLRQFGVEHRANALPRELSGGEAQRVAIARALATDPAVLLMDEPTASLDAERRTELAGILRSLVERGRTLVVATHDEEFARSAATRIVRIENGRIAGAA